MSLLTPEYISALSDRIMAHGVVYAVLFALALSWLVSLIGALALMFCDPPEDAPEEDAYSDRGGFPFIDGGM